MDTQEIIYLTIAVGSAVFAVFLYFKKPQEQEEIKSAVFEEKITSLRELVANLRDNHIHTIESKLDKHIESQISNDLRIANTLGCIETKLDMLIKNK